MVSPIQKWCSASALAVEQQILKYDPTALPGHLNRVAENTVELAAFQKLVTHRKIPVGDIDSSLIEVDLCPSVNISEFMESCPINHDSPIDVLGWMHEYLVSRRRRSSSSHTSAPQKKGGVFYTPQPVVDYILQHTLRPRLETATRETAATITLLDPSAGSGAFLVSAYRMLLDWSLERSIEDNSQHHHPDIVCTKEGWRLTRSKCRSILQQQIFGVDLDPTSVLATRRILWLTLIDASAPENDAPPSVTFENRPQTERKGPSNILAGHALIGCPFGQVEIDVFPKNSVSPFHWNAAFPQVAQRGGFDLIVGNPPYRRERHFKQELDEIAATPLGRFRSARMDLWYYFVHRGIELLRDNGSLSFITNAYWLNATGSDKLIGALRNDVQVDELLLLNEQPVFHTVSGQHLIFRLTKPQQTNISSTRDIAIKIAPVNKKHSLETIFSKDAPLRSFTKPFHQFFRGTQIDVRPDATHLFDKLHVHSRLGDYGHLRQGIAENPASINRRTLERFQDAATTHHWRLGEGVFALSREEVDQLNLTLPECELLRPYHTLPDLARYWLAPAPSRSLVYSTRETCPDITTHASLQTHFKRFRAILDSRRETSVGANRWWHLHWPRDEAIWRTPKLIVPQMATRPSFSVAHHPTYVSFSANVFVLNEGRREDLRYFCGMLNSSVLWAWFQHHSKRRGVGLELNGHTLKRAPIPQIDFESPTEATQHDRLVQLVARRTALEQVSRTSVAGISEEVQSEIALIESQIDQLVASIFQLAPIDFDLVYELTDGATGHAPPS